MEERLQEERSQKEQFKHMKNDIEDERGMLDRTVDKLQREVSVLVNVPIHALVEVPSDEKPLFGKKQK